MLRTVTLALAIAAASLGCADPQMGAAPSQSVPTLDAREARVAAAAGILLELRETVDPALANSLREAPSLPGAWKTVIRSECGGDRLLWPRASWYLEYERAVFSGSLPPDQLSEFELLRRKAEGLRLEVRGLLSAPLRQFTAPPTEFGAKLETLAGMQIELAARRLEVEIRTSQELMPYTAEQLVDYEQCVTDDIQRAIDALEVVRNRALVDEIATGRPSRVAASEKLDALLQVRQTFDRLFESARTKTLGGASARLHVSEVAKRVATPELSKSRTAVVDALKRR